MDILLPLILLGGVYWLHTTGQLTPFLQNIVPKPPQAAPAPTPTPSAPAPAPTPGPAPPARTTAPAPSPPPAGGVTGKTIYPVVAPIPNTGDVTIRGGGNSFRDNIGYPCSKCAREATWIFTPGTGGDWSVKLGSHGSEGGPESLIELGNVSTDSGGGSWRCEGPHMTYSDVAGGTGKAPALAGKPQVGVKAVTWPLPGNKVHHEVYYDDAGTGGKWVKIASFEGSATGCNAITCPVPGGKCQDTLRLDGPSGHKFISRSMVEIRPGGGAPAAAAVIISPARTI